MVRIEKSTRGWGVKTGEGAEMWDARPVITGERARTVDWLKLLFYPKKLWLYLWLKKKYRLTRSHDSECVNGSGAPQPFRILDVGCGTGAAVIEMEKIFGDEAEVIGVDVAPLQVDIARERLREYGVVLSGRQAAGKKAVGGDRSDLNERQNSSAVQVLCYDGVRLPFPDASFDAVHTSDVLGHVADVPAWLRELARVLQPGGALAMFSESRLGHHAYIRNYLMKRGLNVDPHAAFHISLYSKNELRALLNQAGFEIEKMHSTLWAKFLAHPDELYPALSASKRFPVLRRLNGFLYFIKKNLHPVSTALAEFYSLLEMLTLGRIVESQGYVILGRKKRKTK